MKVQAGVKDKGCCSGTRAGGSEIGDSEIQDSRPKSAAGSFMFIDMVKVIKLTGDLVANFPDPSAELVLQINELFERGPILRSFFSHKIGQNRAKVCKNVQKHDRKSPVYRDRFIKACQVARLMSICKRRPKPSRAGRRCSGSGTGWKARPMLRTFASAAALECDSPWSACRLAVKGAKRPVSGFCRRDRKAAGTSC
jgi:hypothetical protein